MCITPCYPARVQFVKLNVEKRQAFGWGYMAKDATGLQITDHSGDVVDSDEAVAALEDAFHRYVRDSREADDGHETFGVAKLIEATFMSPEKAELMGIDPKVPTGLWVGYEFDTDEAGEKAWQKVKSDESLMFSMVGEGTRP